MIGAVYNRVAAVTSLAAGRAQEGKIVSASQWII